MNRDDRATETRREPITLVCPECRSDLELSTSPSAGVVLACRLCAEIYRPTDLVGRVNATVAPDPPGGRRANAVNDELSPVVNARYQATGGPVSARCASLGHRVTA